LEIVTSYVGAAAKQIDHSWRYHFGDRGDFVPLQIVHPLWMLLFLLLTAVTFSLFGFIIGIWADGFEKLQLVPMLIVMPLTFLGGSFYTVDMLPPFWQKATLFNPVVYLSQRIPLELLRNRRWRRREPRRDLGVPGHMLGASGGSSKPGIG
jgi:ABC-2 type transport system permease protein